MRDDESSTPTEPTNVLANQDTETASATPVPVQAETMAASAQTTATGFSSPREFIEKSLDNIDTMLHTIDSRHSAKMTEAE